MKFTPAPPPAEPKTWQDKLQHGLRKEGVSGNYALEGYWMNEVDNNLGRTYSEMNESAIECLICNLHDMSKEDAIRALVDIYYEHVR